MEEDVSYESEVQALGNMLDIALEFGLEVEVVYYALEKMKENPSLTPIQAFVLGVTEFVK